MIKRNIRNKYTLENITNRIFINLCIAVGAYIFLWILISKMSMSYIPVFISAGIFFAAAVICYILYKVKQFRIKNYAYMLAVFSLALIFTQSSFIVSSIIGIHKFSDMVHNSHFMQIIFNTSYEVKFISVSGAVYIISMLIYNCVIINRISGTRLRKTNRRKKNK